MLSRLLCALTIAPAAAKDNTGLTFVSNEKTNDVVVTGNVAFQPAGMRTPDVPPCRRLRHPRLV